MKTRGAWFVIGSKQGNKNRAENCSQCAGKDSKKTAKLPLCVDETPLTGQWSEETPTEKRETFICRERLYSVLSSSSWADACTFWLVPIEGAEEVLGFCDNPGDCVSLCFVIHKSRIPTE